MSEPAVEIRGSTLSLGGRQVWSALDLSLPAGEFLTVIGPNGAGKTSLLRVILGLTPAGGRVSVLGREPRRGDARIGYVPQRAGFDRDAPLRARDLVALGLEGTRWGYRPRGRATEAAVDAALAEVGATAFGEMPVGLLSGGEQQRLRIAQALVGNPRLLLLDEPLLNLDLHHQREVCDLIAAWSRRTGAAVVFVTHDVNPVLRHTHRVLAVAGGRWAAGDPDRVLTTATMTQLFGSPVDVFRVRGRVVVVSDTLDAAGDHHEHAHEPVPR